MRLKATVVQQHKAEEDRRRMREELREQQRLNEAMRSGKLELERARLTFGRFGEVEHDDGRRFRLVRGEIVDAGSTLSTRGSSTRSGGRGSSGIGRNCITARAAISPMPPSRGQPSA